MNASRPFGPRDDNRDACVVCDLLDSDRDPGLAWTAGFALGAFSAERLAAQGPPTALTFCREHGEFLVTALTHCRIDPSLYVRLNRAARGDA